MGQNDRRASQLIFGLAPDEPVRMEAREPAQFSRGAPLSQLQITRDHLAAEGVRRGGAQLLHSIAPNFSLAQQQAVLAPFCW